MKKKFIALEGEKYLIEWYFNDNEKSEALAYFKSLSDDRLRSRRLQDQRSRGSDGRRV